MTWSSSSSEVMFARGELAVADLSLNSAAAIRLTLSLVDPDGHGGCQNFPPKGQDRQLREAFFAAIFSRTLFFEFRFLSQLIGAGGGRISAEKQTADRPHIHSGIFSCSLVFDMCQPNRAVTRKSEPRKKLRVIEYLRSYEKRWVGRYVGYRKQTGVFIFPAR
jgi:hypothetical protein